MEDGLHDKISKLLAKQVQNYEEEEVDWRKFAQEHVFSELQERFPLMHEARRTILAVCEPVRKKAKNILELNFEVIFVIHVDILCEAG
jgi:hypothetical protein